MGILDTIRQWFAPRDQEDGTEEPDSAEDTRSAPRPDVGASFAFMQGAGKLSSLGVEFTRQGLYEAYTQAQLDHTWNARALDIYADLTATGSAVQGEITVSGEGEVLRRQTYNVTLDGDPLPELDEVNRRTQLPMRARQICRDFIGNGDRFDELVYQELGLERLMKLPASEVRRLETADGRLNRPIAFVQETQDGKRIGFERWQIAHFRAGTPDCGYGVKNSLFWWLLTKSRELALMHSGLVLARLTNPDGREVIYVDTGELEGKERERFLTRVRDGYQQTRRVDARGRIRTDASALMQTEPMFIGVSSQRPLSKVTRLPGSSGIRDIKDIEYKRDLLLAGLAVSKSAYGLPVPYAARGAVTEQMRVLQRACRSYRQDYERVATEIYLWGLLSYGISWDFLRTRAVVFEWPSLTHEDDINFLQLTLLRIEIAERIQSGGWLPPEEVMIRYLGFPPDDVEELLRRAQASMQVEEGLNRQTLARHRASHMTTRAGQRTSRPREVGLDEDHFFKVLDGLQALDQTLVDRLEETREALMEAIYSQRSVQLLAPYGGGGGGGVGLGGGGVH